jgi:hypothetical protein
MAGLGATTNVASDTVCQTLGRRRNRPTHVLAARKKSLVLSHIPLRRAANFRKFIFGGIEENQRVEGEKIWFFRISPPYLRFRLGQADAFIQEGAS